MKKLILTAAIAVTLSTGTFAAGIVNKSAATNSSAANSNVSSKVEDQFNEQFAGVENATWSATAVGHKVDFMVDDVKKTAFYNHDGEFIGTTENVIYKALPRAAKKEIAATYQGYQVGEVIRFETPETSSALDRLVVGSTDNVTYFVDLKNDKEEVLLRVTPFADVTLYKQIK